MLARASLIALALASPAWGGPTTIPPACSNTRRSTRRQRALATVIGPPGKRKTRPANAPAAPVTITASGAIRGRNHADAKWSPAPTHERHDGPPGCLGSASGHGQYTGVSLTTKMTCQQPSAGFRGFKLECDVTRWARGIRCDEPLRAGSGHRSWLRDVSRPHSAHATQEATPMFRPKSRIS